MTPPGQPPCTLDLTGQLPTADEVEKFLADKDPAKRAKLIKVVDGGAPVKELFA
jgi:hypothetical protein